MSDSRSTDEPINSRVTQNIEAPIEDVEARQFESPEQPNKDEPTGCFSEPWRREVSMKWTHTVLKMKAPIVRFLLLVTNHAATHPKTYVLSIIMLSCLFLVSPSCICSLSPLLRF